MRQVLYCLGAAVYLLAIPGAVLADEPKPTPKADDKTASNSETVHTYYGLRALDRREDVADEEKLKQWEDFISRTEEQVGYAKKQILFWRNAARLRLVESVTAEDKDASVAASKKIESWKKIARSFPKTEEARIAERRIAYWFSAESKRLVEASEVVEQSKTSKLERIRAWKDVVAWDPKGPVGKGALKRIAALQDQLVNEALSLDKIQRIDSDTKLAAWRDVLAGMPSAAQQKVAETHIRQLEGRK